MSHPDENKRQTIGCSGKTGGGEFSKHGRSERGQFNFGHTSRNLRTMVEDSKESRILLVSLKDKSNQRFWNRKTGV